MTLVFGQATARPRRRQWLLVAAVTTVVIAVATLVVVAVRAGTNEAGGPRQQALDTAVHQAARDGITTSAVLIDRRTGAVLARTDDADRPVASESVVKLFIAADRLVRSNGHLPPAQDAELRRMITLSDDQIATRYWTAHAVPAIVDRYGLTGVRPAQPDPGHWGGTGITATAIAQFLYRASTDPAVGPWLFDAMASAADRGADGVDQHFGFNALTGTHGSKQGWGHDNWTAEHTAVHSVGFTDRYVGAVLQTSTIEDYGPLRDAADRTVRALVER